MRKTSTVFQTKNLRNLDGNKVTLNTVDGNGWIHIICKIPKYDIKLF